jgi:hypothetical protein
MLLGLGVRPTEGLPILDYGSHAPALKQFESLRSRSEHLVATLPSTYEYLASRYEGNGRQEEMRYKATAAPIAKSPHLGLTS